MSFARSCLNRAPDARKPYDIGKFPQDSNFARSVLPRPVRLTALGVPALAPLWCASERQETPNPLGADPKVQSIRGTGSVQHTHHPEPPRSTIPGQGR
eukprot:1971198-Pyramimonas_sp.AAC.1